MLLMPRKVTRLSIQSYELLAHTNMKTATENSQKQAGDLIQDRERKEKRKDTLETDCEMKSKKGKTNDGSRPQIQRVIPGRPKQVQASNRNPIHKEKQDPSVLLQNALHFRSNLLQGIRGCSSIRTSPKCY